MWFRSRRAEKVWERLHEAGAEYDRHELTLREEALLRRVLPARVFERVMKDERTRIACAYLGDEHIGFGVFHPEADYEPFFVALGDGSEVREALIEAGLGDLIR